MHNKQESFQYLSDLNIEQTSKTQDGFSFSCVDAAFKVLGFSTEMILTIYKILSSILHLGNISIEENTDKTSCELKNDSKKWLKSAAQLLNVNENIIEQNLFYRHLPVKDKIRYVLLSFESIFFNDFVF